MSKVNSRSQYNRLLRYSETIPSLNSNLVSIGILIMMVGILWYQNFNLEIVLIPLANKNQVKGFWGYQRILLRVLIAYSNHRRITKWKVACWILVESALWRTKTVISLVILVTVIFWVRRVIRKQITCKLIGRRLLVIITTTITILLL